MPLEYVVPRNPVAILGWGLIFLLLAVLHLLAYIAASLTFWNGFLCYAILWIGPLFALLVSALMIGDGDTLNVPIGIIGGLGSFYIALLILWLTAG